MSRFEGPTKNRTQNSASIRKIQACTLLLSVKVTQPGVKLMTAVAREPNSALERSFFFFFDGKTPDQCASSIRV